MASARPVPKQSVRIFLRPVASGLPLGFFAFATGMLLLACLSTGIIPVDEAKDVGILLVAFVFPLELISTIFAFLARDTMGATTLGLFAASWLSLGAIDITAKAGATSIAVGIYLFGFAAVILLVGGLAWLAKPFFTVILAVASARMIVAGIYEVGGPHSLYKVSGYIAFVLVALALYGGVALALEDGQQKQVLPLFRRGLADEAFQGYEKQLERLEAEPGVRHQL